MTKTRIPRNLKKKLEASLENLSPTEAGRLYVIYVKESTKKGIHPDEYPAIEDLVAAMKSGSPKGPVEERLARNRFNGFELLTEIARMSNLIGLTWADSLRFESLRIVSNLDKLLVQDAVSEAGRRIRSSFFEDVPKPVRPVQYKLILDYGNEGLVLSFDEAADSLTWDWAADQGFSEDITVPLEFKRAADPDKTYVEETEELRRQWVTAEGRARLLADPFEGDEEKLDAWIVAGGRPGFTEEDFKDKNEEFFDALVALVEKGELRNEEAVFLPRAEGNFFVEEGKIPAPFALRAIWETWVVDQGLRIHDFTFDDHAINGIGKIYGETGDYLTKAEALKLVGRFLAHCRRRPWGKDIPAHIKPDETLLRLLVAVATPLIQGECDDPEAMIDYDIFRKAEGFEGPRYDPFPAALIRDLRIAAPKVAGVNCDFDSIDFYESQFYPTDKADKRREDLRRLAAMIDQLETNRRPFTFGDEPKPPSRILGVNFMTPLETTVVEFRDNLQSLKTFKTSLEAISKRYFRGLPIAQRDLEERLHNAEEMVDQGRRLLEDWLDRLETYPWQVDTSSLRIGDPEVNEEKKTEFIEFVIRYARKELETPDEELGIGNGGNL